MYSVIFNGFRTQEQADAFAAWYSGSGEQEAQIWMEEHAGVSSCDAESIGPIPDNHFHGNHVGAFVVLKVIE